MTVRLSALLFAALLSFAALAASGAAADCDPWIGAACVAAPAPAVARPHRPGRSVSLSGVVAPLAAKARALVAICGARVISAVRHTRIAGTRRISLHASGRAVDLAGPRACLYRELAGWPGGVSTDYARVQHVHVSYDPPGVNARGREWGLRFAHGVIRRAARLRYARRR